MRFVIGSIILLCAVPALAQSAAQLDARRAGPGPTQPSYEPPLWLGDEAPLSGSARVAELRADQLMSRFGTPTLPLHWVGTVANYRWEQCLLGSSSVGCHEGIALYERALHERGYQPPLRTDQSLFRLATLLVRMQMRTRARKVLARLIRGYPSSPLKPSALILLGQSYIGAGDPAAAQRYFARAAQPASSERGLACYLAAWAAREAGHSREARAAAVRALTSSRGDVLRAIREDWCAMPRP